MSVLDGQKIMPRRQRKILTPAGEVAAALLIFLVGLSSMFIHSCK